MHWTFEYYDDCEPERIDHLLMQWEAQAEVEKKRAEIEEAKARQSHRRY